jgi:dephospho-CoA kinase
MKVLACTGGIGSGKTYICKIFMKMGIPVYFSDDKTKELYDRDKELMNGMIDLLGGDIIENGRLNRERVARKIFSNPMLLYNVEKLVHPAVVRDFCNWKEDIMMSGQIPPFVIFESAIILEKPYVRSAIADKILTISAPIDVRVERIMKRDSVNETEARRRLDLQWDDKKREAESDFIIFAGSSMALLPQIEDVYKQMSDL